MRDILGCACLHKIFIIRLGVTLSHAAETLPLYHHCISLCTSISLSVFLSISSRLCCLSSYTDLLLFLYVLYCLPLLTHVNRTMTYDHTTPSWRSPSLTDLYRYHLVLFFPILFFFHDALPILLHVPMPFSTREGKRGRGKEGRGKGRGPLYVYILERSYQINQSSKVLMKKKLRQVVKSVVREGIDTQELSKSWSRPLGLIILTQLSL